MPRIRGKKSSNEPSNASEEEAPNAGEQQPAELQPDTTDIRDTQQQLQSHMNQLQTDMTGMKSDMATIMSLLQSLTNNGALPGHQATQTTTTAQQPHAETETRLKQNIPVEANESESDNQPDETRPSNRESTTGAHTPRNAKGCNSIIPPAVENLISNVQDYQVKTTKFTEEYPDISLAPKKAQIVIDEIVYQVLRAVQPGQRIKPVSHTEIALPEAKDVNTVLENAHGKLKRALMAQIQRCWKPKGNEYTFIDRYTTAECIREALEMNYTHPIFIAQTLIEAVKDTRETSDLWRKIRFEFMPQRSTRIVDKDRKPFHILDLYQLACQQSAGHNTAAQVAAQQFQNHEQRGTDTRTYIANKLDRLHALLALYDQLDDSSPENNFITVAIMTALHNISEKANKPMQTAMKQDKESDSPELPWKRVSDISYDALANRVKAYQAALTKLAKAVDIETERRASFGATNRRNGRDNGIHKFPHSKIGGTQSGKNEHGQGNGTKHPPDTSKPCTHYRCKRRKLPPHNVGQLDECGFLCGLQLQGINCPNKGINDYNGRHLYRDTCRQAWEQQRQDSSTGKRPQRRKSPKNGSDNTPTITNMAAIKTTNPSTGRNTTSRGITTDGGAKSQTHESEEVSVTEIEVNFIGNSKQEPAQRAKVPMVLTLDSGSDVCMLKPHAFSIIRHWATDKRSKTLHTGNGAATIDTYKVHYEDLQGKRATLRVYVGEVPTPNNTQGVWPRKLFRRMGFNIVKDESTVTDEHPPQNNAKHHPELRGGHAMLALCAQEDYQKACQEFRTLLQNEQLTIAAIERTLENLPQETHPHGLDIEAALQSILLLHRAQEDKDVTNSELYKGFMEKLIRYADIENAVDEDLRRGHEKALKLFDEYKDQITDPDKFVTLNKAPKMQELTHTVEFQQGARPHADRVIPMAPDVLPIFHEWHDRMVELGCIRKVTDEEKLQATFLLGHLAILKRGATRPYDKTSYRFALNAVPANKWIIPAQDLKPPTYSEIAAFTKGKRVFSVIDVQQFFPSIPAHYPTIVHACKGSWYTYAVTIQGERNATAAAHRVLTHLAGDLISDGKLIAHVDDCLIATNTVEEHLDVLKTLFQKLVEYGLKINAKSIFVRPMVKFLGMLVHQEGVEPDLLRYNAVLLWPVPRTRVQVRKFVGFIQYFHKYIANCSQLLEPLHAIVNGKGRFQWSEAAQTAFDEVRAKLVNCSYLHHIDYETTKHIRVDAATGHGVGCALYQENKEGELVPLMFASRRFSDAEKNYGAGDAEMCAVYWAVTQAFHDIVQHAPIVIHTDHLNNVQILTSPTANSSKRRQRWAFYLGDYNIVEVRHVPGKDLIDADTLSRIDHIPSGATMKAETSIGEMMAALQEIETRNNENRPTMTKKQIREAQNQDPLCNSIKKAILAGTTTANKHDHYARRCDIQDGILKIRDILKQREESRWVIVAPEAIRNTIIDAFHNHPLGHRGIAQTALAIRSAWWWPNQIGDVKNRLSDGCDICTIAKNRGNPHKQGTMSSIQPIHPAQLLAIDIYAVADTEGPPSDYPYALTGVYGFSRYPFIVPIKTKNTEEIVQELEWIFASHGVPSILMHDRGKEFEAEVKLLCESLGVTELKTAPKSPHSNGNVERLHRELEAELVRFRAATKTQSPLVWTRYVPAILIKLRSTINKSTKFSPYELMGAKSPILTGTVPELDDTQYDFTTEFGTDQQWENWIKRLQEKRAVALTNDIESRDRRVEEMNSNRPATAFQVGDWVRIAMQNRNKTSAQVSEPYQVIEVPEEGQTYRVQNPRNGRTRPVGITEMTKTTAPTTAQVNTTAAGQHQNIPVALAKISNGDTTTYEVIEYSSNAKAAQKFKQYKNTRPHSQASMAKWVKTSVTISNPKVIDEFHLTWNPTSKTYVIPRVVRQRNRSITAIQGRKAPAQNTGGNP